MIDHFLKVIFIHLEKTGGTSIVTALSGGDTSAVFSFDKKYDQGFIKHYSVAKTKKVYGDKVWNSYVKFTVVRNPWDRLVSKWQWRRNGLIYKYGKACPFLQKELKKKYLDLTENGKIPLSWFHEELKEECKRWNLKKVDNFLFEENETLNDIYVLCFENLQNDWNGFQVNILKSDPDNLIPLPHINKGEDVIYQTFYTDETKELIATHFSRTIKQFHYTF